MRMQGDDKHYHFTKLTPEECRKMADIIIRTTLIGRYGHVGKKKRKSGARWGSLAQFLDVKIKFDD